MMMTTTMISVVGYGDTLKKPQMRSWLTNNYCSSLSSNVSSDCELSHRLVGRLFQSLPPETVKSTFVDAPDRQIVSTCFSAMLVFVRTIVLDFPSLLLSHVIDTE